MKERCLKSPAASAAPEKSSAPAMARVAATTPYLFNIRTPFDLTDGFKADD